MPKVLLSVPHKQQQHEADCLVACAAMALEHLHYTIDYSDLLRLLNIKPYGAPASNILRLAGRGLNVTYSRTNIKGLETMLGQGHPVIVFLRTGELPHWSYSTDHAVLVVGYDDERFYIDDPDRVEAPIAVPRGDFELAWLEREYHYALITS